MSAPPLYPEPTPPRWMYAVAVLCGFAVAAVACVAARAIGAAIDEVRDSLPW